MSIARARTIFARWCDVCVWYGVGGGAIAAIAMRLFNSQADQIVERLSRLGETWLEVSAVVSLVLILFPFTHTQRLRGLGCRHVWCWPPLWLSIVVGAAIAYAITHDAYAFLMMNWIWVAWPWGLAGLMLLTLVTLASRQYREFHNCALTRHREYRRKRNLAGESLTWLGHEQELRHPREDAFGTHRRLAKRLAAYFGQVAPEVPMVHVSGPLGSGKSSVASLVGYYLSRNEASGERVVFVRVSLWQYSSPDAAVRGTLRQLTEQLATQVGVLHLNGLPSQYLGMLEGGGWWFRLLARFAAPPGDAEHALRRVSDTLSAIGVRLLIWFDDVERMVGTVGEQSADATHALLRPVRSLLYQLDQVPHITCVIADTQFREELEIDKLVQRAERIPSPSRYRAWEEISAWRDAVLVDEIEAGSWIDPLPDRARNEFGPSRRTRVRELDRDWYASMFEFRRYETDFLQPARAVVEVLGTPRSLKKALRECDWLWKSAGLRGEIDPDDLLVLQTIKHVYPSIYALIRQDGAAVVQAIRDSSDVGGKKKASAYAKAFAQRVHDRIHAQDSLADPEYAERLVRWLFGITDWESVHTYRGDRRLSPLVGHNDRPWRKYLSISTSRTSDSEQFALRLLSQWQRGESPNQLVSVALADGCPPLWTHLGVLSPDQIASLYAAIVRAAIEQRETLGWSPARAFLAPELRDVESLSQSAIAEVRAAIGEALQASLPLWLNVWKELKPDLYLLDDQAASVEQRTAQVLAERVRGLDGEQDEVVIRWFRDVEDQDISYALHTLNECEHGEELVQSLADHLLGLSDALPAEICTSLGYLLTKIEGERPDTRVLVVDRCAVEQFFGHRLQHLEAALVTAGNRVPDLLAKDPRARFIVEQAKHGRILETGSD